MQEKKFTLKKKKGILNKKYAQGGEKSVKAWLKQRKNRALIYCGLTLLGLCACIMYPHSSDLHMRIVYERGLEKIAENAVWIDIGEGFLEQEEVKGVLNLGSTYENPWFNDYFMMDFDMPKYENIQGMIIFLYRHHGLENFKIPIQCLEIYNRGICVAKYSPEEIYNRFHVIGVRDVSLESSLIITADPEMSPLIEATPLFLEEYNALAKTDGSFYQNVIFAWIVLGMLLIALDCFVERLLQRNRKKTKIHFELEDLLACATLIVVLFMACKSQPFSHGDEDVLMRGVEFFKSHWLPPDLYSKEALGTFSYAGISRLGARSIYYMLAGKTAWIAQFFFHVTNNYRVFNVLLWILLIIAYFCKKKDHPWMAVALFLTPQIWYMHSYVLSDTWDLFLTFVLVYELVEKDSILQKFVEGRYKKQYAAFGLLFCSGLFALLFMAKVNFYIVLLFAFVELVRKWIVTEWERKSGMLIRYIGTAAACFFILFCQNQLYEHFSIGFASKGEKNLAQEYALEDWTPEGFEEQGRAPLKSQGKSYIDVLKEYGKEIGISTWTTGIGSYAWGSLNPAVWYQILLGILYGMMLLMALWYNGKEMGRQGYFDNVLLILFLAIGYFMVVYTCWTSDFQAQGRYVIMLWPIAAYYMRRNERLWKNRVWKACILFCGILGLYSFVFWGIQKLV